MSIFIDEYIVGVNIAYFLFKYLKFVSCSHKIIEDVPDLRLIKVLIEIISIFDFAAEDEFKFIIYNLIYSIYTFTMPELPQSPALSKECDYGTKNSSSPSSSSIFLIYFVHYSYLLFYRIFLAIYILGYTSSYPSTFFVTT